MRLPIGSPATPATGPNSAKVGNLLACPEAINNGVVESGFAFTRHRESLTIQTLRQHDMLASPEMGGLFFWCYRS